MENVHRISDQLLLLGANPLPDAVHAIVSVIPKEQWNEVIAHLESLYEYTTTRVADEDGAQRMRDAAEGDRTYGQLTDSMADWYDNEIRACYRGTERHVPSSGSTRNEHLNLLIATIKKLKQE